MTMPPSTPGVENPRDAAWAKPVSKLRVSGLPAGAVNLNVDGRQLAGPLQGFGQLWQKTYRVRLSGANVKPSQVIQIWKSRFPEFWPKGNKFYSPLTEIQPGEVAVLDLAMAGPMRLSTGVMVIYSDDESFTFMTPEGHMYAALITFSAYDDEGTTVIQIQPLLRASDPIYEIGMRIGVADKVEDEFWHHTIRALAANFGVIGEVHQEVTVLDPKWQWKYFGNIRNNAAIWTSLYLATAPFRWVRNAVRRSGGNR
jgi:hypothetical protein